MLIKKKTISEKTVEVKLPIFFKSANDTWHAVYSKDKTLKVAISENHAWIRNHEIEVEELLSNEIKEEITEQDFQSAFEMAIDRLRESFIPVTEKQIV